MNSGASENTSRAPLLSSRSWALIIAAAAVILAIVSRLLLSAPSEGSTAEILQDGAVIREIDLSRVAREYSFEIEAPSGGSNTVLVQPGRICVLDADCPDRICVDQGWLSDRSAPIVCMPHRLVIRLKGSSGIDAVAK